MSSYEVGQRVMYASHQFSKVLKTSTVASVGARKIKLDDGSEWNASNGRPWGLSRNTWHSGLILMEYREESFLKSERIRVARQLSKFDWTVLTLDQLREIQAAVIRMAQSEEA